MGTESRTPSRRVAASLTLTSGVAALLVALASLAPGAGALELLDNPDFEDGSTGWNLSGGSAEPVDSPAISGRALHLSGSSRVTVRQMPGAIAGAAYHGTIYVAAAGSTATATLTLAFSDAGFIPIGLPMVTNAAVTPGAFLALSVAGNAPPGAEYATFSVAVSSSSGPLSAFVDAASLEQGTPPPTDTPTTAPTATPTAEATATITATAATPTAGTSATPTATASSATGTAAATATATRSPTPTKTPRPTSTPKATKTPTPRAATKTPKPTPTGTATATPADGAADSGFGGLLANGDFEIDGGGFPAHWSKFGGTMTLSDDAYEGNHAAALTSTTTSTKWLHQVAAVDGGSWYIATGFSRSTGGGSTSLRVSWYASADGSGSAIDVAESNIVAAPEWSPLSTGAIQAPEGARSARVRLTFIPESADPATALFDNVAFSATDEPVAAPPPPVADTPAPSTVAGVSPTHRAAASPLTTPATGIVDAEKTPTAPGSTGLRLSEVLSDPEQSGRDSAFEWVEIFNTGTTPVDTAGWKIADSKSSDTLPARTIPAGGYAVITGKSVSLPATVVVVPVADGEIGGGLNNGGDAIHLIAPDGTEVDAMSFGDNLSVFQPAPVAPPASRSLGVRDARGESDAANWQITDKPTPGGPNSFPAAAASASTTAATVQPTPGAGITTAAVRERSRPSSDTLVWAGGLAVAIVAACAGAGIRFRRRILVLARKARHGR